MERCKKCKHWAPEGDEYGSLRGAGECRKAPQMWDVTDRLEDESEPWDEYKVLKPEHATVLAIVEDGSAYKARLVTMPDFGCVQWAAK